MGNTHDDVARRWHARCTGSTADALKSHNLLDWGDRIMSYGSHFEIARVLRDRKGEARAFLFNGNTYSSTTSRHQAAVRAAITNHGLPVVTLPHDALEAASIDVSTIELIDVQRDWWTTRTITRTDEPRRDYQTTSDDMGGWINSRTGEFFARMAYYGVGSQPPSEKCEHAPRPQYRAGVDWEEYRSLERAYETHMRARHGVWEEVSAHRRKTGRFTWVTGKYIEWAAHDIDGEVVWQRDVQRHWLGASLIRAQVIYRVELRCSGCAGTGQGEKWFTLATRERGIGPLTEDGARSNDAHFEWVMSRWNRDVATKEERPEWRGEPGPEPLPQWAVDIGIEHTECRRCSGRGRVISEPRRRWAHFLSGFDLNETRPSYYFCELPPKARPTTVEEALETLKPNAVKVAEAAGREVKRQGDIFAIPMPTLDLRGLKALGGRHVKRPKLVEINGSLRWSGPAPQLLGTNHEATEIVLVGGQTYARGTISHNPAGRRPDHKRTPLGKQWHLILKNTVPIGV